MDNSLKKKFLYEMQRIRMVEEAIANRYVEQQIRCPVHLSIGQEAVAVGVCQALKNKDYVMSTHRAHAHYLAKGGNLAAMIAEIYGKATGCAAGRGGSMHLIDLDVNMLGSTPIVGSSLPIAVGAAFGTWLKDERRVTVVFFGEGATEEGVFTESINFAALKKLSIIFVCENNLYSVYSPLSVRQPSTRDRPGIAKAHGIATAIGDGNKIEEVFHMMEPAITRAMEGQGPSFLEFQTYRWREHCGPNYDNDIGYRTEEEFQQWKKQCPIENYRKTLMEEGVLLNNDWELMEEKISQEIDAAFSFAKQSPFPEVSSLLDNIYA